MGRPDRPGPRLQPAGDARPAPEPHSSRDRRESHRLLRPPCLAAEGPGGVPHLSGAPGSGDPQAPGVRPRRGPVHIRRTRSPRRRRPPRPLARRRSPGAPDRKSGRFVPRAGRCRRGARQPVARCPALTPGRPPGTGALVPSQGARSHGGDGARVLLPASRGDDPGAGAGRTPVAVPRRESSRARHFPGSGRAPGRAGRTVRPPGRIAEGAGMTSSRPLVTLITPFHNGAELLGPAIESALAQTYDRWEYVLVDNQSTDGAGAVAERYAQRDPRIRLVRTDALLPQDLNYSEVLRRASPESVYCKFVQADDLLFPRCVEEMVALAEAHPRVGIVGAYYFEGRRVSGGGVPYPTTVLPGRDACRLQLQHGHFLFGSPTTVLLRTAMVRETTPYYDPNVFHSDTEACYRDLERWDFGFVHQVLSLMRIDNPGRMTRVRTYYPYALDKFIVVTKYGRKYLSPAEFAQVDAFSR